jgi:hypothetical protein
MTLSNQTYPHFTERTVIDSLLLLFFVSFFKHTVADFKLDVSIYRKPSYPENPKPQAFWIIDPIHPPTFWSNFLAVC